VEPPSPEWYTTAGSPLPTTTQTVEAHDKSAVIVLEKVAPADQLLPPSELRNISILLLFVPSATQWLVDTHEIRPR
jgi:hypothetical protein